MIYAVLVRNLQAEVLSLQQVAGSLVAAGAKGVEIPTVSAAHAEFDLALVAEPSAVNPEQAELMEALGVR